MRNTLAITNGSACASFSIGNTIGDNLGQRGFTTHEHMDELGLINMNGRVYDPMTARFISADPLIQAPMNSQSYNRYSYGWNSPLNGTDPSGYSFWSDPGGSVSGTVNHWGNSVAGTLNHIGDVIRTDPTANMVTSIAIAYFTGDYVGAATGYQSAGAAAGGFAGSMTSSGGDLDAGLKGAATALMFYGVGSAAPYNGSATQAANPMGNVLGHAAVGCVSATMSDGDCGAGAVSAGLADYASNSMPGVIKGGLAMETAYVAIVGGTTSVIAGGKFANGAQTAAFGYLFNELMHQGDRVTAQKRAGYTDGGQSFGGDGPIESICPECNLIGVGGALKGGYELVKSFASSVESLVVTNVSKVLVNVDARGGISAAEKLFDALPRSGGVTATETPLGVVRSVDLSTGGTASIRPFSQTNPSGATIQINAPGARTVKIRFD